MAQRADKSGPPSGTAGRPTAHVRKGEPVPRCATSPRCPAIVVREGHRVQAPITWSDARRKQDAIDIFLAFPVSRRLDDCAAVPEIGGCLCDHAADLAEGLSRTLAL